MIIDETPSVAVIVSICVGALPVLLALHPVASIDVAIGECHCAEAMSLTFKEVAAVGVTCSVDISALTVFLAIDPIPDVARTVHPSVLAVAMLLVVDPFA